MLTSNGHNSILICEWEHCWRHAHHSLTSFDKKKSRSGVRWCASIGQLILLLNSQTRSDTYFLTSQHHAPSWSVSEKSMASCSSFTSCSEMRAHKVHSQLLTRESQEVEWGGVHHSIIWLYELSRNRNDNNSKVRKKMLLHAFLDGGWRHAHHLTEMRLWASCT